MRRKDFLQTIKGQLYEKHKRDMRAQYFSVNQDLKSKNSIDTSLKVDFQNKILKQLKKKNRRAYRLPVIINFTFKSSNENVPSIHNLVKNYMVLLIEPVPESDIKRKNLVLKDDKLVKVITVNYRVGSKSNSSSRIDIKINNFRHFLKDIELIDKINRNDFIDDYYKISGYNNIEDLIKKKDLMIIMKTI